MWLLYRAIYPVNAVQIKTAAMLQIPRVFPRVSCLGSAKVVQCTRPRPKISNKSQQIPRYSPVCPRGQPPGMAADEYIRHRWTSKSCPPSLPWHTVRKPPQRVVHWKLSPSDGGHLGCGIWQNLLHFPPSPVTLCLHLHNSADPPHPKKKTPLSLCGGERSHMTHKTSFQKC